VTSKEEPRLQAAAGYVFRIYLAGNAPNSVQALANLSALCRKNFPASHRIEVLDVLQNPQRALDDAILITPTVVKIAPEPELRLIGNLSNEDVVLKALGLSESTTLNQQ
jgi:circadian clock protein KaiB